MTDINIKANSLESIRSRWDALRGGEFSLDFERAVFLYNILVEHLNEEEDLLRKFIVKVLGEYAGKRTEKFIRMVNALDVNDDEERWGQIGGASMVLLTRVDGRKHSKVWRAVDEVLAETGRDSVSNATFRSILKGILGNEGYRAILTERQDRKTPLTDYKTQVVILQGQILDLLDLPGVREALTDKARFLLGMQTRAQERAAARRSKRKQAA
jgi:hypothetical protein